LGIEGDFQLAGNYIGIDLTTFYRLKTDFELVEGGTIMAEIKVDEERCKGCELCINFCPQKIIVLGNNMNAKGYNSAKIEQMEKCIGCGICATVCPDVAIEIYK
jgi:2-oxoglutarate ferredoxin oxidoreductase subunit delta